MLKGRQGQNEKAEAGTLHYRQTDVRIDGGQARHLQRRRRDVPYGPCGEDPRDGNAGDPLRDIHHPLLHQAPPFCTRGPQPAPTNAGRVCVKG